jgi:hypothetical protein
MRQHKRRHRLDQHKRRPHLLPRPAAVRRPRPHRPSLQLGLGPTAHPRPHRPIRAERAVDETTVNVNVNGIERTGARSEFISGAQRISSEAITPARSRGNQRQSEAISPAGSRANQRQSEAIRGNHTCGIESQSEAIRGNLTCGIESQSEAIRGNHTCGIESIQSRSSVGTMMRVSGTRMAAT